MGKELLFGLAAKRPRGRHDAERRNAVDFGRFSRWLCAEPVLDMQPGNTAEVSKVSR